MFEELYNLRDSSEVRKRISFVRSLYLDGVITRDNAVNSLQNIFTKVGGDSKPKPKIDDIIKYIE